MNPTKLDLSGVHFLTQLEGVKLQAYRDSAGYWTIGVGHLLTPTEIHSSQLSIGGQAVSWRDGITSDQAAALFKQDVAWAEKDVADAVTIGLNQNQFNALVSFTYNVGDAALLRSTLLKQVNRKAFDRVPYEMMRWVSAGGKEDDGLVNRRRAEGRLWALSTGIYPQ